MLKCTSRGLGLCVLFILLLVHWQIEVEMCCLLQWTVQWNSAEALGRGLQPDLRRRQLHSDISGNARGIWSHYQRLSVWRCHSQTGVWIEGTLLQCSSPFNCRHLISSFYLS